MKKRNEDNPESLGGLGGLLPAEVLKKLNELLEHLHQSDNNKGSTVINIYEKGSMHIDRVDKQNFYGDKWAKALQNREVADGPPTAEPVFDKNTPLSALFRENFHGELRKVIESWRPYLIGNERDRRTLEMSHFEFDKDRIYSNKVYRDLCELDALGALQVSLSQLARYLADNSNLSRSYASLYQQLKYYRSEYE